MKYWKDANEAVSAILKFQQEAIKDADLGGSMKKLNQLIVYDYSEDGPGAKVWCDCRGGQLSVGSGEPPDKPDLVLSCSCDIAHEAWSNKLNPVVAITRKQVRVTGSATGLLKLAPKAKQSAVIYNRVLAELGMADKIMK